jgi:hypothetical protein
MTIVTGCTIGHQPCVKNLLRSAKHFNYNFLVYDYCDTGFGIPFKVDFGSYHKYGRASYKPKFHHKPWLVNNAIYRTHDFLVYMDADTEFKAPINDVMTDDYDVGLTADPYDIVVNDRRHVYKDIAGWLNAGVIFFNNTEKAKRFIGHWKAMTRTCDSKSDQHALHTIAFRAFDKHKEWYPGTIREYKGVRLKLFDGRLYNYIPQYRLPSDSEPRILHYVGSGCNYVQ